MKVNQKQSIRVKFKQIIDEYQSIKVIIFFTLYNKELSNTYDNN